MGVTAQGNLRLDVPDVTLDDNTWGTILNTLISEFELAITGIHSVTLSSSDHTLDVTGGTGDRARRAIILCTSSGDLAGNVNIIAPTEPKIYIISNKTTDGTFTVGIKTTSGARINVPKDEVLIVFCDGTDFFQINATVSGTVANATDSTQLISIAGANFGQFAVKNQWTKPQILLQDQVTLTLNGVGNNKTYAPNQDVDTNILVTQAEMQRDVEDLEIQTPTGTPVDGQIMVFTIEQRSNGPINIVWNSKFKWPDNTSIQLTQTIDKIDAFSFMYNSNVAFWLNFGTTLNIPRA